MNTSLSQSENDLVLNRRQAAEFLKIGISTLGKLDIPKTLIRRRILYRRDILEKWLKENTEKGEVK